jgi:lipoprotein-releasing system permease protein
MFFELFVAIRYLKSKDKHRYISFNTYLSVFMVAIGVFTLIVVVSVMDGFQEKIKEKLLSYDYHIYIKRVGLDFIVKPMENYKDLCKILKKIDFIKDVEPEYRGEGIIRGKRITGAIIRGVYINNNVRPNLLRKISSYKGNLVLEEDNEVLLGQELAIMLGVSVGSNIDIIVPRGNDIGKPPAIKTYKVKGIFKTGYYPFDEKLVVMRLSSVQKIYNVGDVVNGIGIKVDNVFKARKYAHILAMDYGIFYVIETWEDMHRNLYSALNLEKLVMIVILFLIVVASSLNITGTLVMMAMEKRKAIGILKSIGAKPISIVMIFIITGFLIGFIGGMLGIMSGLYTSLNLQNMLVFIEVAVNFIGEKVMYLLYLLGISKTGIWINWTIIPSGVYYLDEIPTKINPIFITMVFSLSLFFSILASIIPGISASKLKPANIMRYE